MKDVTPNWVHKYFGEMPDNIAPAARHAHAKGQYVMQLGVMKFAEADMLQDKADTAQQKADAQTLKAAEEETEETMEAARLAQDSADKKKEVAANANGKGDGVV